jgi:hypothetical protein
MYGMTTEAFGKTSVGPQNSPKIVLILKPRAKLVFQPWPLGHSAASLVDLNYLSKRRAPKRS